MKKLLISLMALAAMGSAVLLPAIAGYYDLTGTKFLLKGFADIPELSSAPGTPGTTVGRVYTFNNGFYFKDDAGTATNLLAPTVTTAWDDLGNPDANDTITFGTYTATLTGAHTAADGFTIQNTGNFGDISILKVQQTTGNPTNGTVLEVISGDTDADALVVTANAVNPLVVSGDGTTQIGANQAGAIDFVDFDVTADGAVTLASDDGPAAMITLSPSAAATTGLDASDSDLTNALSIGANTITGTTAVIDFTNFDVATDGDVTCVDLTASGNVSVGSWAVDAVVPASAAPHTLTVDGAGAGGVTIGGTSTGDVTLGDDVVVSDTFNITIGEGSLTVDDDQNETAVNIQSDHTNTGSAILVTAGTTTSKTISVTTDDITSGTMLYLDNDQAGAFTGKYIQCYDGAADDFSVALNGATTIAGAADADELTITAGDLQMSDGFIDVDDGYIAVNSDEDHASNVTRNYNGAGTSPVLSVVDDHTASTNCALSVQQDGNAGTALYVNQTGTGNAIGINLDVSGDLPAIDIDAAAARDGDVIDIAMANMLDERAINVTGAMTGAAGEGVIEVHTTGNIASTATLLRLDADTGTPAGTQGYCIYVDDDAGAQANAFAVEINSENNEALNISKGILQVAENAVFTAGITDNGSSSLGNAVTDGLTINSALQGASPLILDGATDDTSETTIAVTDPTGDNTITIPDYTGSLPLVIAQGYTQTSQAGAGTSDVTGSSLTLADGWFSEGNTIRYTVVGSVVGANAAISVALYFEDQAVCTLTTADGAAGDYMAEFEIIATASNTQRINGRLVAEAGTELKVDYATDNTDTAAAGTIPIKLQITSGNAGDTITSEMVKIEYWLKTD